MASNPFRATEQRIATGAFAARLLRNADPHSDPKGGTLYRLPADPPADEASEPGQWPGRWAVLTMLALTLALTGVFLVVWLTGDAPSPSAEDSATPRPAQAPPALSPAPLPRPPRENGIEASPPAPALSGGADPQSPGRIETPYPPSASAAPGTAHPVETAGLTLTPEERHALLTRGEALFAAGDLAAARPLLEKAALAGDGTAALRLGQSYDAGYLAGAGLRPGAGNLGLAIFWYRRGQELGNGTAAFLARQLETAARADWRAISARPPAWRP